MGITQQARGRGQNRRFVRTAAHAVGCQREEDALCVQVAAGADAFRGSWRSEITQTTGINELPLEFGVAARKKVEPRRVLFARARGCNGNSSRS